MAVRGVRQALRHQLVARAYASLPRPGLLPSPDLQRGREPGEAEQHRGCRKQALSALETGTPVCLGTAVADPGHRRRGQALLRPRSLLFSSRGWARGSGEGGGAHPPRPRIPRVGRGVRRVQTRVPAGCSGWSAGGSGQGDAAGRTPQPPRCLPRHFPVLRRHRPCPCHSCAGAAALPTTTRRHWATCAWEPVTTACGKVLAAPC